MKIKELEFSDLISGYVKEFGGENRFTMTTTDGRDFEVILGSNLYARLLRNLGEPYSDATAMIKTLLKPGQMLFVVNTDGHYLTDEPGIFPDPLYPAKKNQVSGDNLSVTEASGDMVGTCLQQIALITQTAVEEADAYLNGTAPEEEKQLIPCIAITADNVEYLSQFVYDEGAGETEAE